MGRDRGEQATPDLFSTETVRDGSPSPIKPIPATQIAADASSQRHVLPKNLRTAVKHLSDGISQSDVRKVLASDAGP